MPDLNFFRHADFEFAFIDEELSPGRDAVLLVHGFGSNHVVNWVSPGWVSTLTSAGYRVIAFDHRGHGRSSKSYRPEDYSPDRMAGDAAALLSHLGLARAHIFGYSMGARVAAFMALAYPKRVATLVMGGLGIGMVEGVGDWDPIAEALLASDPASITGSRGKMFRAFADQTRSDRRALAACIETSRTLLTAEQVAAIGQPTLIAVGEKDDIAGSAQALASLMPDAVSFVIEKRDHMLAVGDRAFKTRVLDFLEAHPMGEA